MNQLNNSNKKRNLLHKNHVVSLFALVGLGITAVMGVISLVNHNIPLAAALFTASFIYFSGYYIDKKYNNTKLSSAIVLYSLYLLMLYLVFTGGVENTGPLWIYIVAPVSVFIHGLKRGLLDITLFMLICIAITFIPLDVVEHANYSMAFKLRLLYSFLTITFLSALYEYSRNLSYQETLNLSRKYKSLALMDPLTQLSNRRNALNILQQEQTRALRNKEPFSILLCDIDLFKEVNDLHGHNIGDLVLTELAMTFKQKIRAQDHVARWGGEEFIFILPQTRAENAMIIAEKIRKTVAKQNISYANAVVKVTVSIGIAQYISEQDVDQVINTADKYLYQAKNAGRNRVCCQPIEQLPSPPQKQKISNR